VAGWTLLAVGPPVPRRAPGRVRLHRVRPRTYATPLGFRERHQPPDPARSHAGTNGDDFPRLGLTSARKRGEAGRSVIGLSGLRVAAECAGGPLG
jgi:hypothetical protein